MKLWLYVPGLRWDTTQDVAYTLNYIMQSWVYSEQMPFRYTGARNDPFLLNLLYRWHYNLESYRVVSIESLLRTQHNLRA